jgi:hypothetical protein
MYKIDSQERSKLPLSQNQLFRFETMRKLTTKETSTRK